MRAYDPDGTFNYDHETFPWTSNTFRLSVTLYHTHPSWTHVYILTVCNTLAATLLLPCYPISTFHTYSISSAERNSRAQVLPCGSIPLTSIVNCAWGLFNLLTFSRPLTSNSAQNISSSCHKAQLELKSLVKLCMRVASMRRRQRGDPQRPPHRSLHPLFPYSVSREYALAPLSVSTSGMEWLNSRTTSCFCCFVA
jgi:hypothetical protein